MKTKINYTNRVTPKFDAVCDIIEYLGRNKWEEVSHSMSQVKNPRLFESLAGFAGIEDFPVEAWYDLYQGEGAFQKALAVLDREDLEDGIGD